MIHSTTVRSMKSAIDTYKDKNIILIFGGKNKSGDFKFLNDICLKKNVCLGNLSLEIKDVNLDYKNFALDKCVNYAFKNVEIDDVILFSCGCSSLDLFSNYKEREKYFDELI